MKPYPRNKQRVILHTPSKRARVTPIGFGRCGDLVDNTPFFSFSIGGVTFPVKV